MIFILVSFVFVSNSTRPSWYGSKNITRNYSRYRTQNKNKKLAFICDFTFKFLFCFYIK